jgi:hypothetical protein
MNVHVRGRDSLIGYALRRHGDLWRRVPNVRRQKRLQSLACVQLRSTSEARRWMRSVTPTFRRSASR